MQYSIDIDVPFLTYTGMSEKERFDIEFVINYSNLEEKDYFSETSLEDRSFGFVKSLMGAFMNDEMDEMMKILMSLSDYAEHKITSAPAWKVILTLQFITKKVSDLIAIENEMLTSKVQDNKYVGQIDQIDFSMFDAEYVQTRELANKDITKFEAIRALPYKSCLIELIYKQKESDLDRLIMKSMK